MTRSHRSFLLGLGVLSAWAGTTPMTWAQEAPVVSDDEIIVTGTRVVGRSRLDTVAPVDVITAESLANAGSTELNQALTVALPSFTFPRPAITDGTDSIRPATLRGLAPDQTLVLVNSKRRHASGLVNINGSIGRGSAAVDLNAIPTAAISSVEVLRDGAAAQYGSDAIAGVINLRLREAREGGAVSYTLGQYFTEVDTTRAEPREEEDGTTSTVSGWAGLPLGADGFITVSGEYLVRDPTSRGDRDPRITSAAQSPTGSLITSRYGDPEIDQGTVYVNAGLPLGNSGWEAYGWAGYQTREANSAANPRLRSPGGVDNNAQTVAAVTPVGFLPLIAPDITDTSVAGGVRGVVGGWDVDASLVYGNNRIEYSTINSLNASFARAQTTPGNPLFGQTPKRNFDAGALEYEQVVANIGVQQTFAADTSTPVTLAFGVEYRAEEYAIEAGEQQSYDIARDPATGLAIPGIVGAGGAQGFPGLQPADAGGDDRDAFSLYADVEANVTPALIVGIAARYEDYSDFGSTLNGKASARYDFTDWFAVRGAVSSGFRAPSMQQQAFRSTATNFINGVPVDVLTTPADSALAATLGAQPLKAESSSNYSVGGVFRALGIEVTVDAYRIEISDRIVLSDNIQGANFAAGATLTPAQQTSQTIFNLISAISPTASAARFFINGVDSETEGVDVVARYGIDTAAGDFDFTVSGNLNQTEITRTPSTSVLSALPVPPVLFPINQVLVFERGTPAQKYSLGVDYEFEPFGATFRATHYGSVLVPQANGALTYDVASALILDAEARAAFGPFDVALGVNNFLDEYPSVTPTNVNTNGPTAFSSFSPFGFNGRYVYGKVGYKW
ncbi:MAG: TonB-dependent receptor [Hyphomonadaceae bacterium]|nr:TonB-dependent receptor [Hyphomonadaceae bacterium]